MATVTVDANSSHSLKEDRMSNARVNKRSVLFTLLLALLWVTQAQAATPRANIEVQNPATSNGVITFEFTPSGGAATLITVEVRKGWDARRIAREIASELNRKLPRNYRATPLTRGNRHVVDVRKDVSSAADFDITKTGQTVQGTSVVVRYVP